VRKLVPKRRLLEFRVQEGWEPLYKFLDRPVPNSPFPMTNGKAELEERIKAFLKVEVKVDWFEAGVFDWSRSYLEVLLFKALKLRQ